MSKDLSLILKFLSDRCDFICCLKVIGHDGLNKIVFTHEQEFQSLVRLSLLTMTNPNQLCDALLFMCSKMADALALAFRCARFCSASLILFASYSPAPLFMKPRHFVRSCAICSHDSVGMLKSLREALRVSLYRFF